MTVKEVTCEGDAQVVGMRGKIKHICDFTAAVDWSIKLSKTSTNSNNSGTNNDQNNVQKMEISSPIAVHESKGNEGKEKEGDKEGDEEGGGEEIILKMTITDITSDGEFEFEIIYPKMTISFTTIQKSFLSSNIKVLENAVRASLNEFLDSFKQK